MSSDSQLHDLANAVAEEILRTIYGDDFAGCRVSLESIAAIVYDGFVGRAAADRELLELHAKGQEAIRLLATPPGGWKLRSCRAGAARALLSDRLDTIRTLSRRKIIAMTTSVKAQGAGEEKSAE